jgi:uncharacterized phage-associated protein
MARTEEIKFEYRKLEELILRIAQKASNIGVTKLEKLLYLCDFICAERTGKPISGDTYRRFQMGPVPKHFVQVFEGMKGKDIEITLIPLVKGKFSKVTPKREPKSVFSAAENDVIRYVLNEFGHLNSDELVAYVHHDITCKATKRNAEIPYSLAPYRRYQKPEKAKAEALKADPGYLKILEAALS